MAAAPRTGGNRRSGGDGRPVAKTASPPPAKAVKATGRRPAPVATVTADRGSSGATGSSGGIPPADSPATTTVDRPAPVDVGAAREVHPAQVQVAFALGWQVAQMYHDYFGEGGRATQDSKAGARLPGLSELTIAERRRLLATQIGALSESLLSTGHGRPHHDQDQDQDQDRDQDRDPDRDRDRDRDRPGYGADRAGDEPGASHPPSVGPLLEILGRDEPPAAADRIRRAEEVAQAVWKLHIELLEALTVRNFRLGKSYGLGRALAETVMYPPTVADKKARAKAYADLFDAFRLETVTGWLQQLKGDFPPHASYAVKGGLQRWQEWVNGTEQVIGLSVEPAEQALLEALHDVDRMVGATGPDSAQARSARQSVSAAEAALEAALETAKARLSEVKGEDLFAPEVPRALRSQGDLWRGMLSGELAPIDVLDAAGYVAGGEAMLARVRHMAAMFLRQYRWIVLGATVVLAAVIVALAVLPSYDTTNKVATEIVAVLAALGLSVKGVTSTLGRAITNAEAPLWESEIDESCAVAATRLPGVSRASRAPDGRVKTSR